MTKKRVSKFGIALIAIFMGIINAQAASSCTYQERANLNEIARNVKTSYEIVEKKEQMEFEDPVSGEIFNEEISVPEFKISVYNITKDIYITQSNGVTKESVNIYSEIAKDGVYTFTTKNTTDIVTYTYKVYSNLDSCRGEVLRTYTIKKPKANIYASFGVCQGLQDIPYCKPYITENINVTEDEIQVAVNKYLSDRKITPPGEEEDKTFLDVLKDNWVYIIIGGILVIGATGATIYIVKKRRSL